MDKDKVNNVPKKAKGKNTAVEEFLSKDLDEQSELLQKSFLTFAKTVSENPEKYIKEEYLETEQEDREGL